MDNVVYLAVLLRRPLPDVLAAIGMGVEPGYIGLSQVHASLPVHNPLGHGLANPARVGDPHRLRRPEPLHLRRLPKDREAIRREREHAVETVFQWCIFQRRHHLTRRGQGTRKVRRGEGHLSRRHGSVLVRQDVLGRHQQRLVQVRPYAVGLAVLPEVHRPVLVPHERLRDPFGPPG